MPMRDIGSHAPHLKAMRSPKALGNRRSGRAGEPATGEWVGASESLDDVPQDLRLPCYPPIGPTHRLPDLYGSLSTRLGIRGITEDRAAPQATADATGAGLAQLVERWFCKPDVAGSNPAPGTSPGSWASAQLVTMAMRLIGQMSPDPIAAVNASPGTKPSSSFMTSWIRATAKAMTP